MTELWAGSKETARGGAAPRRPSQLVTGTQGEEDHGKQPL